jgi:hypothetical protein
LYVFCCSLFNSHTANIIKAYRVRLKLCLLFGILETKDFVDTLFEVIDNKSYIKEKEETSAPLPDSAAPDEAPPTENDATLAPSDQQLVTSTSKIDIKREEVNL